MKLYLAERDPQHFAWGKHCADENNMQLRILLSYWYYKNIDLDALFKKYFTEPYPDVFADSGAFSADSQGVQICVKDYADWVKRWRHLFTTHANLDVIGNPEATWKNQQELESLGLAPLPVFHTATDFKWLEYYIERYSYIALGGMVPYARNAKRVLMPYLVKCFRMAQGKAVFHGFGATSWVVISSLPWYSVDSSSWGSGFRYGQVPLFSARNGKFEEARLGDVVSCHKHAQLFHDLGFDANDFADRKRNDRAKICAISALSYMKAEQWLRKLHGEIKIPQRDDASAVLRLHLADANPARYGEAIEGVNGVRLHLADTSNGINWGDADRGLKLYGVATSYGDATDRQTDKSSQYEHHVNSGGTKIYLSDAQHKAGDIIRAMDILNG